jgi:hypothetical protein
MYNLEVTILTVGNLDVDKPTLRHFFAYTKNRPPQLWKKLACLMPSLWRTPQSPEDEIGP